MWHFTPFTWVCLVTASFLVTFPSASLHSLTQNLDYCPDQLTQTHACHVDFTSHVHSMYVYTNRALVSACSDRKLWFLVFMWMFFDQLKHRSRQSKAPHAESTSCEARSDGVLNLQGCLARWFVSIGIHGNSQHPGFPSRISRCRHMIGVFHFNHQFNCCG